MPRLPPSARARVSLDPPDLDARLVGLVGPGRAGAPLRRALARLAERGAGEPYAASATKCRARWPSQRRIERRQGRTSCESEALDVILEHAFETWGLANARLRREHRVFERDGWRCTFPGCTSYGNLHDHHIEYRSHGGSDDLSNRTTLCAWHHQRGEHAKVVRCRGKAPGRLRFALGLRAGCRPLARYRSGDVLVS